MNELKRLAYLDAMGVDAFVSRRQLPGAAVTRRLALVGAPRTESPSPAPREAATAVPAVKPRPELPRVEAAPPPRAAVVPASGDRSPDATAVEAFSLAAIVAGGLLWLEDLGGMPLAAEQVTLVRAMADAISLAAGGSGDAAKPEVSQFSWPMHTNRQLDLGPEAAAASLSAYIRRRLERSACRGLVLLGDACGARVPPEQLDGAPVVQTVSTAAMLENPLLKKQAWRDLQLFIGGQ